MDSLNSELLDEIIQSVIVPRVTEKVNEYLSNDLKERIQGIIIEFITQIDEVVGANIDNIIEEGEKINSLVQKVAVMYLDIMKKLDMIMQMEIFSTQDWTKKVENLKETVDLSKLMVT